MNGLRRLVWNPAETPEELQGLMRTVSAEYPIEEQGEGTVIRFVRDQQPGRLAMRKDGCGVLTIGYGDVSAAARGLGQALAGKVTDETLPFRSFGIMLDCSRGAVMRVDYLRKWMLRLALLGYNLVMLYTEDTYQLEGEDYFGYLRGGYTFEEIREVDAYAETLGIEVVGCIQTLGHLENAIRWGGFPCDTEKVLLVDDDRTYQLIDKMLDFWSQALRSRRIHVGMDETHSLGRGVFLDRHGYERRFDIFNRHLQRVNEQCQKRGLQPIIWSDMYFRMGSKDSNYYDPNTVIPEDAKQAIPQNVSLCYWDYYHANQEFYDDWIARHQALGVTTHMASGIWSWQGTWYNHSKTACTVRPCLKACRKAGIQDVYFTMWGDNGAYCDYDSTWVGLAWAAGLAWSGEEQEQEVADTYEALLGTSYQEQMVASDLQVDLGVYGGELLQLSVPNVLWDDPLLGISWREIPHWDPDIWTKALAQYRTVRERLQSCLDHRQAGDIGYAWDVADVLVRKIDLRQELMKAYGERNRVALVQVQKEKIPGVIAALRNLSRSFRRQWMRRNKPFGLEIQQVRFAGLIARYEELDCRIQELLDGSIERIEELDVTLSAVHGSLDVRYDRMVSGSFI